MVGGAARCVAGFVVGRRPGCWGLGWGGWAGDGAWVLDGGASDGNAAEEVVADVVGVGVDEVLAEALPKLATAATREAASVAASMARKEEVRMVGS